MLFRIHLAQCTHRCDSADHPVMTTLLAQMMPGMEWIPVMLVLTVGGLADGFLAILLRPFGRPRLVGRRLGIAALVIGIVSPLFFLVVVGNEVFPIVYLSLAGPAVLGGIAVLIYPRTPKEARGFPVLPAQGDDPTGQ